MSKWQAEKRYEWALQWQNVGPGAPQWRYWDPGQLKPNRWQPFNPPLSQCLTANAWYTFTLAGEINDEQVHYHRFNLDQNSYPLDIIVPAAQAVGEPGRLAMAVQLDGNTAQAPYEVFIDQISFIRQAKLYLPLILKNLQN